MPSEQILLLALTSGLVSEVLIVLAILLVVFIVFRLGKLILKLIFGVVANSVLGLIAILLANYVFGIELAVTVPALVATILFGLPAVGTMIIMKIMGG